MSVSFTNHIGRAQHDGGSGKSTSISNAGALAKTERHNNHDYSKEDVAKMQSDINLDLVNYNKHYDRFLNETDKVDLVEQTKKMYDEYFGEAVAKYNQQQIDKGHSERQITDYFEYCSNSEKLEVAVEGIIQVGDASDWAKMSLQDRLRMEPILLEGLKETLKIPGFKLVGASFHVNEQSPHLHYVGITVDTTVKKTGLEVRNCKSAVFRKKIMGTMLQDNVRAVVEPLVMKEFGWELDQKKSGRNEDLDKNTIMNQKLQEKNKELELQNQQLQQQLIAQQQELTRMQSLTTTMKEKYQELQKAYQDAREWVLSLYEAIQPFERLRAILNALTTFKDDFLASIEQIREEYRLTLDEQQDIVQLCNYLEDEELDLDQVIEVVETVHQKKSISEPER